MTRSPVGTRRTGTSPAPPAPARWRAVAAAAAMLEDAPDFAPVPCEHSRYDGWTPAPQRAVGKLLGTHGCVRRAGTALVIPSSVTALRAHAQATLSGP